MGVEYREDFLQRKPVVHEAPLELAETNKLLLAILGELRKDVAKQRCVISVTGGTVAAGVHNVDTGLPPVNITFMNEGNPVKSLFTVIVNGSDEICSVTINEPNIATIAGTNLIGNGIIIPAAGGANSLSLPNVEIQWLSIGTFSANPIPVNGTPNANGAIWVYGWTLPEYSNITE